jgi:hypothetical protein
MIEFEDNGLKARKFVKNMISKPVQMNLKILLKNYKKKENK